MLISNRTSSTLGLLGKVLTPYGSLTVDDASVLNYTAALNEVLDQLSADLISVELNGVFVTPAQLTAASSLGAVTSVLPPTASIPTLRTLPIAGVIDGTQIIVVGVNSEYSWNAEATGVDDGSTIILPNSVAPGDPGRWLLTSGTGSSTGTISTLTYDPSATPSLGVFIDFSDMWTAYEATNGAVILSIQQGTLLPTGTFTFRKGTRVIGAPTTYDPSVQLTAGPGTVLVDLLDFQFVTIESTSDAQVFAYSDNYPNVMMRHSNLRGNGTFAMVEQTEPGSTHGLNFTCNERCRIEGIGGAPVFSIQGTGGPADKSVIAVKLGQECVIGDNCIISNTDASFQPTVTDITASMSFNQPGYNGENSPLDPNGSLTIDGKNGINVHTAFNIYNPASGGAPGWLQIIQAIQTTDATPTPIFPVQAVPPVISVGIELRLVAREAATGDTAFWIIKGMVVFSGGGAAFGPLGLTVDFHDATPGAALWDYDITLNSPDPNNVNIYAIGELGKTIQWSASVVEVLVLAI